MGSAGVLSQTMALRNILNHIVYTLTRLEANPLTAALTPEWKSLEAEWVTINNMEIQISIEMQRALARIVAADDILDPLVDQLSNLLLSLTGNDRSAALYVFYFKNQRPSDLKRPVLGKQLDRNREWIEPLKKSPNPDLQKFGALFQAGVKVADAAVEAYKAAKQRNQEFRMLEERKLFVDRVNGQRKATYGKLAEMPHANTSENLASNFADRFFKSVTEQSETSAPTALSSVDLEEMITNKEGELEELRTQLVEALAREEAEAKREQDRAALEEELAKAREEAAKLQARMAELEKKLTK